MSPIGTGRRFVDGDWKSGEGSVKFRAPAVCTAYLANDLPAANTWLERTRDGVDCADLLADRMAIP